MNKNLFKTFAIAAMTVLAGACAKENEQLAGPSNVTFEVSTPEIATKAIGDGMTATKLYYQVFDADGKVIEGLGVQNKDLVSGKTTVSFQLVKDQTYNFIFWAQTAEAGYYTIDEVEGLKKITADYSTHKEANDENRDAFYAVEKNLTVSGPVSKNIELKRPFAQVNIATVGSYMVGEKEKAIDFSEAKSSVKVVYIPTLFTPLETKQVSKTKTTTFATAEIPEGNITVADKSYKYMAMNYIFASEEGGVYDITATLTVGGKEYTVSVPNAPLKRNWRTNIVGDFLTTSAEFNVIVAPGFETETTDMDLNNPKNETELAAALATFGQATISNNLEISSRLSSKSTSTLTIENDASLAPAADFRTDVSQLIFVGGGKLTLDGEGTVVGPSNCTDGNGSQAILVQGGTVNIKGNLTIEGGSGSVANHAVTITNGTANIYGGYFHAGLDKNGESSDVIYLRPQSKLNNAKCNIYGGVFETDGDAGYLVNIQAKGKAWSTVAIYGGTFVGFNPAENSADGTPTNYVAEGYRAVETTYEGKQAWKVEAIPAVGTQDEFNAAIETAAGQSSTIVLASNSTVTLDNKALDGKNANVTIIGDGTQTFDVITNAVYAENGKLNYQRGSSLTLKNVILNGENANYRGVVCDELTLENCVITGMFTLYSKAKFVNCTFNQDTDNYNMWTYGSDVEYVGCTFNGKGKFLHVYNEGGKGKKTVKVENCTFNNDGAEGKPAINIKGTCPDNGAVLAFDVIIKKCTVNGAFPLLGTGSIPTNSGLWQVDKPVADMQQNQVTVTIDDDVVYPVK